MTNVLTSTTRRPDIDTQRRLDRQAQTAERGEYVKWPDFWNRKPGEIKVISYLEYRLRGEPVGHIIDLTHPAHTATPKLAGNRRWQMADLRAFLAQRGYTEVSSDYHQVLRTDWMHRRGIAGPPMPKTITTIFSRTATALIVPGHFRRARLDEAVLLNWEITRLHAAALAAHIYDF